MRLLDLFCGRWGWSKAFAARGWEGIGVDLDGDWQHSPSGFTCIKADVLTLDVEWVRSFRFDFACASSPCEEFSVWGMKHFHPHPKYPENGIKLFNHTREILEASGVPYVMENVRAAQQFVGNAVHHCGPFYLWGNAVPPLMHKGIIKGWGSYYIDANGRKRLQGPTGRSRNTRDPQRHSRELTAKVAQIPPELAKCVADYAERLLETKSGGTDSGSAMSRAGYSQDCDGWDLIRWRGAVMSAIRGRRGQDFLKEMLRCLDAMPNKSLIAEELQEGEEVCALGSVGMFRGIDMSRIDPEDYEGIARAFGIAEALAREVMYENDEGTWRDDPKQRWEYMRKWVVEQIRA